jgi:hypothetical protein
VYFNESIYSSGSVASGTPQYTHTDPHVEFVIFVPELAHALTFLLSAREGDK